MLASSAVMAAGTVVSRLSGFVRSALLAAALGLGLHADVFNIANTIPNTLYILLAGGVFNAVLVPQLVRARHHDDGGEAYTDRVVTLAAIFLAVVTVALVVAAPLLMDLYLSGQFQTDALAPQRDSAVDLARWCLPQVFFYGMYVLVGQILNARGNFGPMMWAPIANNLIAIAVLVGYLVAYGPAAPADRDAAFSSTQELVLGLGSTIGIVAQLLILLPVLRKVGVRIRPRFDLRDSGLGHTLRLGVWTVLFVVVNQIAYTVVVRLASGGVAQTAGSSGTDAAEGTGYSVYALAFLIVMVPHAVVTVSLATAALPTLSSRAAAADHAGLARTLGSTLRTALAVILPFAAILPFVAGDAARVLLHGAAAASVDAYAPVLALFGAGVLLFTVHYVVLRGFYALELTRAVFVNQCFVAATNIVAAVALVTLTDPEHTALSLVGAYIASYAVGAVLSYGVLRRRLGGLDTPRTLRFLARLVVAVAGSTLLAGGLALLLDATMSDPHWAIAAVRAVVVVGLDVVALFALARRLGIHEVSAVVTTLTRRSSSRGA